MDYVIITAILTFFVLLFFLKNQEGYTDSYINATIESLKKTNENITKTVTNIKDLTGLNTGNSAVNIDVLIALEQMQSGIESYKSPNSITLKAIELEKDNINVIQNNVVEINKKLKEVLDPVYVSIVRLKETRPVMVPLLTALNYLSDDITTINNKLQTIPDK